MNRHLSLGFAIAMTGEELYEARSTQPTAGLMIITQDVRHLD
jgi:hypothetical protein